MVQHSYLINSLVCKLNMSEFRLEWLFIISVEYPYEMPQQSATMQTAVYQNETMIVDDEQMKIHIDRTSNEQGNPSAIFD
jgi:hypothetical protein